MQTIPVYFIPDLAPIAQVIAMPMHRRPRKHARASTGAAEIIPMPRTRGGSYKAAKEAVEARCTHLHLQHWQTDECLGRVASEIRRGRSTAVAVAAGITLAKLHARDNDRRGPGSCA
jgi:hypothetical protein